MTRSDDHGFSSTPSLVDDSNWPSFGKTRHKSVAQQSTRRATSGRLRLHSSRGLRDDDVEGQHAIDDLSDDDDLQWNPSRLHHRALRHYRRTRIAHNWSRAPAMDWIEHGSEVRGPVWLSFGQVLFLCELSVPNFFNFFLESCLRVCAVFFARCASRRCCVQELVDEAGNTASGRFDAASVSTAAASAAQADLTIITQSRLSNSACSISEIHPLESDLVHRLRPAPVRKNPFPTASSSSSLDEEKKHQDGIASEMVSMTELLKQRVSSFNRALKLDATVVSETDALIERELEKLNLVNERLKAHLRSSSVMSCGSIVLLVVVGVLWWFMFLFIRYFPKRSSSGG